MRSAENLGESDYDRQTNEFTNTQRIFTQDWIYTFSELGRRNYSVLTLGKKKKNTQIKIHTNNIYQKNVFVLFALSKYSQTNSLIEKQSNIYFLNRNLT